VGGSGKNYFRSPCQLRNNQTNSNGANNIVCLEQCSMSSTFKSMLLWMGVLILVYLLVTHGIGTINASKGITGGIATDITALQGR